MHVVVRVGVLDRDMRTGRPEQFGNGSQHVIHKPSFIGRTLLLSLLVLAACSEGTGPGSSAGIRNNSQNSSLLATVDDPGGVVLGKVPGGFLVTPALRLTPLAADVSWSFVAGPLGATSTDAGTGLTVVVPPGALSTTQTITVTALAGAATAYRFEPHGLVFDKPVDLYQSLSALANASKHLRGAYFPDDVPAIDPATGLMIVTELEPTKFDKKAGLVRIKIKHFSGYAVISGYRDAQEGETTEGYNQ